MKLACMGPCFDSPAFYGLQNITKESPGGPQAGWGNFPITNKFFLLNALRSYKAGEIVRG